MTDRPYTPRPETLAALLRGATQIRVPLDLQPSWPVDANYQLVDGDWRFTEAGGSGAIAIPLPYAKGDLLYGSRTRRVDHTVQPYH